MKNDESSSFWVSRRTVLAGVLAGTAGIALTGCSGSGGSSSSSGDSVDFTSFLFGVKSTEGWIKSIDKNYSEASSGRVSEHALPYDDFLHQIVLKAKAGNVSGVAHIDEAWLSTLATAGVLKSTDDFYKKEKYPSSVRKSGTYNGSRYTIPWTQSGIGPVSNTEILEKAGVTSPLDSVDDFTAALRKIKRADKSVTPYAPCTNVDQLKDMIPWMWTFGSPIFADGKVTLGDSGSLAAIDYWKKLLDEHLIGDNIARNDARTLFAQGRVAIYEDAPQAISVIPAESSDKSIKDKMAPMSRPSVRSGNSPRALVWSQPLVTFDGNSTSREYMTYLSTNMGALKTMFTEGGQPPTTVKSLKADWFTADRFVSAFTKKIAASATLNPFWHFPSASAAENIFNESIEAALKGSSSPKAAMKSAKDELEGLLK